MSALDIQVDGGHYKNLKIQPVEYIHANGIGYMEGNVIKYVTRWRDKNGIKDLEKAKHYIELLIEMESKEKSDDNSESNNNNGWIEWHGGDCPVDGGQMVEIKPNNLCDKLKNIAGNFYWGRRNGFPYEIIAYRVIKND